MFAKLLKHEMKSTGSVMGVLSLAALGLGLVGTVILRVLVNNWEEMTNADSALVLAPFALIFALIAIFLGLMAYVIGGNLFVLIRFYKNKFTDEGYLTFTLPVNVHQIFVSSWVNILIWELVSMAVMYGVIFSAVFFGTSTEGLVNMDLVQSISTDILPFYGEVWQVLEDTAGPSLIIALASFLVQLLSASLLTMTSIVLGATIAKKHKLLASVGIYYGISAIIGTVTSVISVIAAIASDFGNNVTLMYNLTYTLQLLLQIALGIGAYLLSVYLMRSKLNLP